MDPAKIEERIDKVAAGSTEISMSLGGVQFRSMMELMEFAKLMAVSDLAVPYHLRGNPGACLAICTKALRFGFDPFALAEHSFAMERSVKDEASGRWEKIETIAYDSFVVRAVINAHAPIDGQIIYSYEGEGEERRCIATATLRDRKETVVHRSRTLGELKAARGRNDKGQIKGSPLWDSKPDQQLAYDTGRDLCRKYFPETLLGWYDKEELDEYGVGKAKDITPAKPDIADRLKGPGKRGFSAVGIEKTLAGEQQQSEPEPDPRALAFDLGEQARANGLPITSHQGDQQEAFADGWRAKDSEILQAELRLSQDDLAGALRASLAKERAA